MAGVALPPIALGQVVLPSNGQFVIGTGTINTLPSGLVIDQAGPVGIVQWSGFSVGSGASVHFNNGAGATLNRVTGNIGSRIDGALTATGSLYLVNGAGVVVGRNGVISTGGSFFASTHDVSDGDFLNGGAMAFAGGSQASVVNLGTIEAKAGDVALIARAVNNEGSISAANGSVGLLAGYEILARDAAEENGLFSVVVGGADTGVTNSGDIAAANAELRANGGNVYALAGNTGGVVKASGATSRAGRIFLTAGALGNVKVTGQLSAKRSASAPVPQPRPASRGGDIRIAGGDVVVNGELDGAGTTGAGGTIVVTGHTLSLGADAVLNASGATGGTILIGGDYQGGVNAASNYLGEAVATADGVTVAGGARILADGSAGAGGNIVVWSDRRTSFQGAISARGAGGFKGGDAEVSGKAWLDYRGTADLRSDSGRFGTLLLDPYNITISSGASSGMSGFDANGNDSVLNVTTLTNALALASVTVTTGSTGAQAGNITVAAPITWSTNSILTLNAAGSVVINSNITATGTFAGLALQHSGGHRLNNGARITLSGASSSLAINGEAYTLIRDIAQLQNLTMTGYFALADDIDASGTASWNAGAGFEPIGIIGSNFTGILDGLNHSITGLTINRGGQSEVGLFALLQGEISNLALVGGSIAGGSNVGALVGLHWGTITNVHSSAAVSGVTYAGGLVGITSGATITRSSSTGDVTGGAFYIGGLVGRHSGLISESYATGAVTGTTGIGGLVGSNRGVIEQSFATGAVNATGDGIGGFVGDSNLGVISDSYATGSVTGGAAALNVGGFIGTLAGGSLQRTYSTGAVTGTTNVGGYAGNIDGGTIVNSYWNTQTSGLANSNGTGASATAQGLATAQTLNQASFVGWSIDGIGGTGATWRIYEGQTGPLLRALLTPLTVTGGNVNKTYDGTTTLAGVGTLTYSLPGYDNAEVLGTAGYTLTSANAGTYTGADLTLGGLYSSQQGYDIISVGGTATINQRAITVTADAGTMTYGNAVPTLTYTVGGGGLVNGDALTGALASAASSTSGVGTYGIMQGTLGNANYAITYAGSNMAISARAITVTADAKIMTYGNTTPTLTHTVTSGSLVNGDSLSGLASTVSSTSAVGTYGITQGTLGNANYAITYIGANVTVAARALTVTADAKTMTYGDTAPTLTYTLGGGGLVNGDALTGALASTASSTSGVGGYGITQGTLAASSNYAVTYIGANVSIAARALTVTANDDSRIYDGTAYSGGNGATYTGFVNGESAAVLGGALIYGGTSQGAINAGSYGVALSGLTSGNYDITYVDGTLTVAQRALTVTADNLTKTPDEANPPLTYTIGGLGLVGGDSLSGLLSTTAMAGSPVGSYSISQGTLSASSNYLLSFVNGTLTVAAKQSGPLQSIIESNPPFGLAFPNTGFASSAHLQACDQDGVMDSSCAYVPHPANLPAGPYLTTGAL
ncbi:hypothetical protein VW29_14815 [Devosia limi DSM 17137]|nr:hypothetical protein VW29_14815 [Devosia limi DSM 17137]